MQFNKLLKTNYVFEIILILSFLFFSNENISDFLSTTFGRMFFILSIIVLFYHNKFLSIVLAIVFVLFMSDTYEGMTNPKKETKDLYNDFENRKKFLEKHCDKKEIKNVFIDDNGNELSLDEIKQKYPHIKFDKDVCNPCDEKCNYTFVEGMTVEEELRRSKESRGIPVSRKDKQNL